jgi:hypothetical protein
VGVTDVHAISTTQRSRFKAAIIGHKANDKALQQGWLHYLASRLYAPSPEPQHGSLYPSIACIIQVVIASTFGRARSKEMKSDFLCSAMNKRTASNCGRTVALKKRKIT